MKCGDCGQECANIGAIQAHKKNDCPARKVLLDKSDQVESESANLAVSQAIQGTPGSVINPYGVAFYGFIPTRQLPEQVRVLSPGQTLRLKVIARLTADGALVESTEFWI